MGLFHSDSNRIIKHFLQEGIWLKTDPSAQGEHTSFLGPLLPGAYFVPALFLPQCLLFIPLPLPEVQVLHPLRMGLLGFWNHPALIPLISVLRIQVLVSQNVVWPFKPHPRSLDGFTLGSEWSILPLFPNSAASGYLRAEREMGPSVGRDLEEVFVQHQRLHHFLPFCPQSLCCFDTLSGTRPVLI